MHIKALKRIQRHKRIRARIKGTAERPRLSVYRSRRALYVQLIDDEKGVTLAQATTEEVGGKTLRERAAALGKEIALRAKAKKITHVVFDRGGFLFAGKIQAVADGAREGGLIF